MSFGSSLALSNVNMLPDDEIQDKRHQDTQIIKNLNQKVHNSQVTPTQRIFNKLEYPSGSPPLTSPIVFGNLRSDILKKRVLQFTDSTISGLPSVYCSKEIRKKTIEQGSNEKIIEKESTQVQSLNYSVDSSESSISEHSIEDLRSRCNRLEQVSSKASSNARLKFWNRPKFIFDSFQNLSENEELLNQLIIEDQLSFQNLQSKFYKGHPKSNYNIDLIKDCNRSLRNMNTIQKNKVKLRQNPTKFDNLHKTTLLGFKILDHPVEEVSRNFPKLHSDLITSIREGFSFEGEPVKRRDGEQSLWKLRSLSA